MVDPQVSIQEVFESDNDCQQEHEGGANGGGVPAARSQKSQRSAVQQITQPSLAGQWRLIGSDLDQGNEMNVPGNQDDCPETAESHTQAERQVSRPINAPRSHILALPKRT